MNDSRPTLAALVLAATAFAGGAQAAMAAEVKVTPLGSHDGEFCSLDRALGFEDTDGTRILFDAGRTVRGADDPRLGRIDAVRLSHVHGDHLGDVIQPAANAGSCAWPDFSVPVTPSSNTVNITVGKKAKLLVGAEMGSFFAAKFKGAGGEASQVGLVRFGASTKVGGVKVATVPPVHSNGLAPSSVEKNYGEMLAAAGLTACVGPPGGYVLTCSNGLVAYLSGDTGITAEQEAVVRRHHGADLVVINTATPSPRARRRRSTSSTSKSSRRRSSPRTPTSRPPRAASCGPARAPRPSSLRPGCRCTCR